LIQNTFVFAHSQPSKLLVLAAKAGLGMTSKDIGICLARREYSETSQIATIFSREHGKIRGIAKGARRSKSKFGQGIELLSRGQVVFSQPRSGSGLVTLTEWTIQESYQAIRRNLRQLYRGYYLGELVDLFTEELDPHPRLFDLLETGLADLATKDNRGGVLAFQVALLQEVGLSPELDRCGRCGKEPNNYVSFTEGGVLCAACAGGASEKSRVNPAGLGVLRRIIRSEASEPSEQTARQVQQILSYWIRAALNREPKTMHLLR
jgi:DNA repair protein RecO (recombination protein O)